MQLQVVDAVCEPSGSVNEDRWGASDGAIWVLDGATGLTEQRLLPGPSDALWLVEQVDAGLKRHAAVDASPADILRAIVRQAQDQFARQALRADAAPADRPSTGLTMLRLRGDAVELGSLGDCRIVHPGEDGVPRCFGTSRVTALDDRLVEEVVRLQASGLSHEQIWRDLLPMIRRHRALVNLPEGYWVLDLSERGLAHIEVATVPAAAGAAFLLLSDGFYRLVDLYHRYSYAALFQAAQERGLRPLHDELRAIEAADAECRRHPRLKPRDDATAVLASLVG
jgi:serine/threonine protein phosphatase PrpC